MASVHKAALWKVAVSETVDGKEVFRDHYVTLGVENTELTPEVLDALGFVCFTADAPKETDDAYRAIAEKMVAASNNIEEQMRLLRERHNMRKPRGFKVLSAHYLGECLS
jgi:hypothetical protein